jgi:hypothetical protein
MRPDLALTPARPLALDLVRVLRDADWATPTRMRNYLGLLALANLAGIAVLASYIWTGGVDPRGEPVGSDFVSFWAAGKMALAHRAAQVYAPQSHLAAERAYFGAPLGWYAFFYPPVFLLACLPLGLAPYFVALGLWLASTFAAFAAALRGLAPRFAHPLTLAAAPAVFSVVGHGQNAFLSTALFAAGTRLLERQPTLAGAMFGMLCFKPQLALLAPLGLLVTGRWRALAAFVATAAALAALSACVFGLDAWTAFLAETTMARATLERGLVDPAKMQSVFAAVRVLGGAVPLAYFAQGLAAVAALGALVVALRREPDARRQFAAVAVVTCLTTPFLLDYDLTLLLVPIAVLAEEGLATGFRAYEKTALAAAFLLPAFARPLAEHAHLPLSPLVVAALALAILRRMLADCPRPSIAA